MSRWDLLVRVATLPELSRARYGFTSRRRGGCQLDNPSGDAWPRSKYINCCTFVAQALGLAQHLLGCGARLTRDDWATAMCHRVGDPGAPKMAADMGLSSGFEEGLPEDYVEGEWGVAQGWRAGGGHSWLFRAVPAGEGAGEIGYLMLEAVGKPSGGAWRGLDGVGSRTVPSVPNARNWGDWFPEGVTEPLSHAAHASLFPVLYTARLA